MLCPFPRTLIRGNKEVKVPCGKCEVCRDNKRREYTVRLNIARSEYANCYFVTFTFREEEFIDKKYGVIHPAYNREEAIRCYQLFMKKLRRMVKYESNNVPYQPYNKTMKYFSVLEQGKLNHRYHWHTIFFTNLQLSLAELQADIIDRWEYGMIDIGYLDDGGISYVTKYLFKDQYKMLISSGLGYGINHMNSLQQYTQGCVHIQKYQYAIPKTILQKIKRDSPSAYKFIHDEREKNMQKYLAEKDEETPEEAARRYYQYIIDKRAKEQYH